MSLAGDRWTEQLQGWFAKKNRTLLFPHKGCGSFLQGRANVLTNQKCYPQCDASRPLIERAFMAQEVRLTQLCKKMNRTPKGVTLPTQGGAFV